VLLLASSHARTKLYRRQKATAGKTPAKNEKKMGNEHKKKKEILTQCHVSLPC